jgi:hypothetical protein
MMVIPAATMVVVVGGPTLFRGHAAVRTSRRRHIENGDAGAACPVCDEGARRTRFVPMLLRVVRSGERNGRR